MFLAGAPRFEFQGLILEKSKKKVIRKKKKKFEQSDNKEKFPTERRILRKRGRSQSP